MRGVETGVGLLGFGTVGTGTWQILQDREAELAAVCGTKLIIKRILVRDIDKERGIPEAVPLLTEQFTDLMEDDSIRIVVDAMGGEEPALSYIQAALKRGKHLVTANKEVMAKHGPEIYATAAAHGCRVFTEACVAGGIPLLHPLHECFAGNALQGVAGIINGTTNYILTAMTEAGQGYSQALKEAQALGYAEADPAADVEGLDALYKTVILAREALGVQIPWKRVSCIGITAIQAEDMQAAERLFCRIKLIGFVQKQGQGICAGVEPMLIPREHILAAVQRVQNGVMVQGDAVGEVFFAGPGAGKLPTASAVVSDLVRVLKSSGNANTREVPEADIVDSSPGEYYLRWKLRDTDPQKDLQRMLAPSGASSLEIWESKDDSQPRGFARVSGLTQMEKNAMIAAYLDAGGNRDEILALRLGLPLQS